MLREGYLYGAGFCIAAAVIGYFGGWAWALPVVPAGALVTAFFRDPERVIPSGPVAVAPADGKVIHVRELPTGERRISIFLSIFNVHINRIPVAGEVVESGYQRGKYLAAWDEKASVQNEQSWLTIDADGSTVVVKQIAGLLARRIICTKKKGDRVATGERMGYIKFGSRTDLILGPEWEITATIGNHVKGGASIMARRRGGKTG